MKEVEKMFIENQYIMYLRKSRSDNPSESVEEVLSRHEKQLQELAVRLTGRPLEDCDIYREIISGGEEIENRPAFMKVLQRMERGDITGVLVIDTQRLSRSGIYGAGDILNAFEFTNTLICTPSKTYNLNDRYDKKFLEMEMIQSSDYLNYTKEILARGRMHSLQNGCYISSVPPYGYDREKLKDEKGYKLVPNEEEAEIVKMIYDLFLDSLGTITLANYLNDMGLKTRRGNPWTPIATRKILTNPTYYGELIFGRRKQTKVLENGRIVKKTLTNSEPMLVKGKHEPLITREQFEAAQEKLKSHPSSRVPKSSVIQNSLAGLVICEKCGRTMIRKVATGHDRLYEKRVHELTAEDKTAISNLIRSKKAEKGLSLSKIAKALDVEKTTVDSWFSPDIKRAYFSKKFASYWHALKKLLDIQTSEYDSMITEYHKTRGETTLVCPSLKCSTVSSQLSRVEAAIIDALEEHLENYKYFIENYADEIQKEEKANIKILARVEKKIEKLNKEKRNALRNYNAEDITREEYLELKTDIEAELKELENQRIEIEASEQNDKLTQYQKAVPILSACINQYHTLGVAEQNELLKSIIEKVIYSKTARVWKSQEDKNFRLEVFLRI